jgi:ABC-type polysaccharide/polyol phosphate transport system ATPase subunit
MPAPWPAAVVIRVADGLVAEGRWRRALALLVAARREQPADTTIGDRLKQVFEEAQRQGARPQQLRQAHRQLPLSDRRLWGVEGGDSATAAPLVSVRNISVRFGEPRTQLAGRRLRSLFGGARPSAAGEVWAVRDVSFELRPGELLGIIGRNGAGKSTLLNVLADQVAPSSGDAIVNGRRLLLTQGLGFLPGLTGRENLILGGLYLGLRRSEVERRFEEMVEFAELWDAIDRPLRTYSSGMRSRLQFALATAVEPDILLLDELLGAGDAAFVEKAQARMQRTLERARAVIVVTHDMGFVAASCTQAIVLEGGEVAFQGDPENAVACYVDILAQRPKRVERGPGE